MRIGILGSGLMGAKLGTIFARAGHEASSFSYSQIPATDKLEEAGFTRRPRQRCATERPPKRRNPVRCSPSSPKLHWSRIDDVLKQAGDLTGKVIVTCCLPMNADNSANSSSAPPHREPNNLQQKFPRPKSRLALSTPFPAEVLFDVFEGEAQNNSPESDGPKFGLLAATIRMPRRSLPN